MSPTNPAKSGFIAGLAAGAAILAIIVLVRLILSVPTFTELLWDFAVGKVPGPLFSTALDVLKYAAKPLFLVGLTLLQVLIAGILGIIYATAAGWHSSLFDFSRRQHLLMGIAYGLILWVAAIIVGNLSGAGSDLMPWVAALAAFLAFGLLTAALLVRLDRSLVGQEREETIDLVRRDLLFKGIAGLIVISVGGVLFKAVASAVEGGVGQVKTLTSKVTTYITPNDKFYRVSKNLNDPVVDAKSWHLEIVGSVSNPLRLTLDDIRSMPAVVQFNALECISNEVGGDLIGNAVWKGVPLRDLLEKAGVSADTVDIALHAADQYADSIPVEKAMAEGTTLAYEMNGEALPHEHGFPLRLLVPGIYGMKNVKWITGIEAVTYDFQGFWQEQGWSDTAVVRTMSRIDVPDRWDVVSDGITISGIAFAGDRGISRVEISFDNGQSWQPAVVGKTESPYTWALWTLDWQFAEDGPQTITVRATDGQGSVQDSKEVPTYPNGATGYHKITVTVRRS